MQISRDYSRLRLSNNQEMTSYESATLLCAGGGVINGGLIIGDNDAEIIGTLRVKNGYLQYRTPSGWANILSLNIVAPDYSVIVANSGTIQGSAMKITGTTFSGVAEIQDVSDIPRIQFNSATTLLSPDGNTNIVVDNTKIVGNVGGTDRVIVDGTNSDIYSPDGLNRARLTDSAYSINFNGTDRFFADGTTSQLISPAGNTNLLINNTKIVGTVGGTDRVIVDGTNSVICSPNVLATNITLSNINYLLNANGGNRHWVDATNNFLQSANNTSQINVQNSGVTIRVIFSNQAVFDTTSSRLLSPDNTKRLTVNNDYVNISSGAIPASSGATGTTGDIAYDATYLYVCVNTNTWKRVAFDITPW